MGSLAAVLCSGVIAAGCFLLTGLREIADALQVANDTGHVVNVLRMAVRALLEVTLVNVPTVVAHGVRNVEKV